MSTPFIIALDHFLFRIERFNIWNAPSNGGASYQWMITPLKNWYELSNKEQNLMEVVQSRLYGATKIYESLPNTADLNLQEFLTKMLDASIK